MQQPGYGAAPNFGGAGYPTAPPAYGAPAPGFGPGVPQPGFNVGGQGFGPEPTGYAPGPGAYNDTSGEAGPDNMSGFGSKAIRMGFIRKVYSILSVQLLVTFGFVLIFVLNDDSKKWAARNSGLLILAFVVSIASMCSLACCGSMRRKFPHNFICLGIFTLAQSFLLGFVTAFYKTDIVMLAIAMTAAVCITLTIFAFQTKIDFTPYVGVAMVGCVILMMMGFILMFFNIPFLRTLYAAFGALLFSIYLIIDTQMIVGGSHKNQISPEEYIFGAITLYTDIINIFMFILQLLGNSSD